MDLIAAADDGFAACVSAIYGEGAEASRGMVHAEFFSIRGELVASVTQEGLLRPPRG